MADLVFTPEPTRMGVPHLSNLATDVPDNCGIYVFYVPGIIGYEDLKKALLAWGESAGTNIFVGLWDLSAVSLKDVLGYFQIKGSPAVAVLANPKNSTDGQFPPRVAYARIDNPILLNDLARAEDCINRTCNLFLQGRVKDALSSARKDQYKASLNFYLGKIGADVLKFLKDVNVTFDILKGTITLSAHSDSKTDSKTPSPKGK
ncbi:MAG: hypothetical protein ABSG92_04005 [Conexivisphaerales archaeon]|jgi:hypothetical protein